MHRLADQRDYSAPLAPLRLAANRSCHDGTLLILSLSCPPVALRSLLLAAPVVRGIHMHSNLKEPILTQLLLIHLFSES